MNKAERAEMDRLRTALALRWPSYSAPVPSSIADVKANLTIEIPARYGGGTEKVARVWSARPPLGSSIGGAVRERICDGVLIGDKDRLDSWWRGDILFASEADALRYVRVKSSEIFAERLAELDAAIVRATVQQ